MFKQEIPLDLIIKEIAQEKKSKESNLLPKKA